MFIIRKNDGSIKFAITNDYIMQGSNDVNYVDFAIEGRDNTTWSADCLFGLPGGSTLTLAGVPQDITYSGETYSGYRVWLKSSVTIYAGTLSIAARQYDNRGSILYTYPYSQTVNATVLEDDWEAPTTQATYQSFMALITTYLNAFDPHLIRKYNSLALANDQLSSLSLNQVVYVMNTNGNYDYYIKSDATTLTQIHTQEYITLRSEYITAITNAITDGVLTTRLAKNSGATLQAIVDLKNTFYVKSLVYSKTEADNKFLTSAELNNYLTIASASETYETKVDSASKLTEAKTYTDTNVATLNAKDLSQDTAISTAQTKADSAYELASGKANTYIFDTYALMKSALASASSTAYHLGDNLLIKETGVSDYWVSAVNATQSGDYGYYEVSEDEINLEPYQKKVDNALTTADKTIVGSINELNSLKAPISTTQTKTDNTLNTTNKTIVGGINENKASIDTLSDEVISNVGKLQQIDLVGTLAGSVITFETSDTYTLKENCTYELDLHFNVAGAIDNSYSMVLKINGTTINLQNILNNTGTMLVRDMLQVEKYTNAVGYRWIFNAVYNTVNSNAFFGIPATISKSDIISLSTSDITAKLQTFDKGQVVQDIDTGLFYIISVDFATETRSLTAMPSPYVLASSVPTKTSDLTNDSNFVSTTDYGNSSVAGVFYAVPITDLTNTVEIKVSNGKLYAPMIPTLDIEVVSALPTTGSVGVIYLVPKTGTTSDQYDEWVWVNSAWEQLGGVEIDLSGYLTSAVAAQTYQTIIDTTHKLSSTLVDGLSSVATSGSWNDLIDKPTIIANFYINGTVATDGTITFNSLTVADLITAITKKSIITFIPTNTDLNPVKLSYKHDGTTYTLLGSYSVNNTTSVLNYECMITIIDGVAEGSMSIISTQPLLVSGTNIKTINGESVLGSGNIKASSGFKQTFMYNGSEYAYCYKGLNEMLKEDDISLPNLIKIQLNGVDISFPYFVTSENTFNIVSALGSDSLFFYGNSSFTLTANSIKTWDGTLEWSNNNGSTWSTISAGSTLSGTAIYVRGTGNTYLSTPGNTSPLFSITGSGISVAGNIENTLDYATVALGNHPTMASSCYNYMFYGCTSLVSIPSLPATTLADYCYNYMFYGCTSLVSIPSLPATTLASNCYNRMFYGCTSLVSAPSLPATTLANNCYYGMFSGCTSLVSIPSLPATTLASYCYKYMFNGCTKIKLSTTQTGEYQNAYRIPTTGTGTTGNNSLTSMFESTGGTYTSDPSINTTYYTSNLIV